MPPPRWLERLLYLLLPPATREQVLGDLREICHSAARYIRLSASVLPAVVVSRIRRTTDAQSFSMQLVAVYLCYLAMALWMGQQAFLYDHAGLVCLAVPTILILCGLLFCNAYAGAERASSIQKPVLEAAGSVAFGFLGQAVLFDLQSRITVPFGTMLYGSCAAFVLISALRILFPPIGRHRKA